MLLKVSARWPISSRDSISARADRSPSRKRSAIVVKRPTGPAIFCLKMNPSASPNTPEGTSTSDYCLFHPLAGNSSFGILGLLKQYRPQPEMLHTCS